MSILVEFLNRAAGFALGLDPEGARQFARLEGRIMAIELTAPALTLYLSVEDSTLKLDTTAPGEADVTLRGSAAAFARLGASDPDEARLGDGGVTMQGDVQVGQAFQKALAGLDVDWEEGLARFVGDTPARKLGNTAREFGDWSKHTLDLSRQNLADYLSEESELLVSEVAFGRFEDGVRRIRADVDRLEQRVEQLARAIDHKSGDLKGGEHGGGGG